MITELNSITYTIYADENGLYYTSGGTKHYVYFSVGRTGFVTVHTS